MSISGIDHIQLAVPAGSEARAREFYGRTLGLAENDDPALRKKGTVRFDVGTFRLDIAESPLAGSSPQSHVALRVNDYTGLIGKLRAAGVRVDDSYPLPGYQRAYTEDPFGNVLELLTPIIGEAS